MWKADGLVCVVIELTAGLPIFMPVKLGTLASELTIVSRVTEFACASGTADAVEADGAVADVVTALAVPSKLGMLAAILEATLVKDGADGGGRVEELGAEPPMAVASPANEGMLLAMMSVMPARVGKAGPWSDPAGAGGGASSPLEGTDAVMSSSADRSKTPIITFTKILFPPRGCFINLWKTRRNHTNIVVAVIKESPVVITETGQTSCLFTFS